jgi:hypothetical protein
MPPMKNSKDTIGNRTRVFSAGSAVPQPPAPRFFKQKIAPSYNKDLNTWRSKVENKIPFLWFSFAKMFGRLKIFCGAQNIEVIATHNVCSLESPSVEARSGEYEVMWLRGHITLLLSARYCLVKITGWLYVTHKSKQYSRITEMQIKF